MRGGVVNMGKGDKRTKRGKIFSGTYGKFRPKKSLKSMVNKTPVQKISSPEAPKAEEHETAEVVE